MDRILSKFGLVAALVPLFLVVYYTVTYCVVGSNDPDVFIRYIYARFNPPKGSPHLLTVLLADLEEDSWGTKNTKYLWEALSKSKGFEVIIKGEPLILNSVGESRGSAQEKIRAIASEWMKECNADIVIWGRANAQEYHLGFIPLAREAQSATGETLSVYTIHNLTIPKKLSTEINNLLHITTITYLRPLIRDYNMKISTQLRPMLPKLRAFLQYCNSLTTTQAGSAWLSLGLAHLRFGQQIKSEKELTLSISAHKQALRFFDKEKDLYHWSLAYNNLGIAQRTLGEMKNDTEMLHQSVGAFLKALSGRDKYHYPKERADTQNNLGNALTLIGQREKKLELLDDALQAYQSALEDRSGEPGNDLWAITQNNLGNYFETMAGINSSKDYAIKAVDAHSSAVKIFEADKSKEQFRVALNNLMRSQKQLEALTRDMPSFVN